jgi:hypothetical protein
MLPPGQSYIPFNFTLPCTVASSLDSVTGQVHYTIRVKLEEERRQNNSSNDRQNVFYAHEIFLVLRSLDLNKAPVLGLPKVVEKTNLVPRLDFYKQTGPVGFKLSLPKTGFVPGEAIVYSCEVNNGSIDKLVYSFVYLIQTMTFYANYTGGKKVEENVVGLRVGPSSLDLREGFEWKDFIMIPMETAASRVGEQNLIHVGYEVRVSLSCSNYLIGNWISIKNLLSIVIAVYSEIKK